MTQTLPTREFMFLRHGETQYNKEGRLQGRIDVPLNEAGLAQAESVAGILATCEVSRIVSSPAQRVLQTIQPYLRTQDLSVHLEADLMEFFVGSFQGQKIADLRASHALSEGTSWLSILPADAEHWTEFSTRVCCAVARWTQLHADETILIASHGLVFHALVEALTGKPRTSQNAEPHRFRPTADGWEVSSLLA